LRYYSQENIKSRNSSKPTTKEGVNLNRWILQNPFIQRNQNKLGNQPNQAEMTNAM